MTDWVQRRNYWARTVHNNVMYVHPLSSFVTSTVHNDDDDDDDDGGDDRN